MKRLIGISLSIALGLAVVVAVPVSAEPGSGAVVDRIGCQISSLDGGGISAFTTEGHRVYQKSGKTILVCIFDATETSGAPVANFINEGFSCNTGYVYTTDSRAHITVAGNALLKCVFTP